MKAGSKGFSPYNLCPYALSAHYERRVYCIFNFTYLLITISVNLKVQIVAIGWQDNIFKVILKPVQ